MYFPIKKGGTMIYADLELNKKSDHCVILMHGYDANRSGVSTTFMANHLTELGIDSLRFDLPGCGDDELPISECTVKRTTSYLETIVDHLQMLGTPYRTFSLFGSSGSSPVALSEAAIGNFNKVGLQAPASFEYVRSIKQTCDDLKLKASNGIYSITVAGKVVEVAERLLDIESQWTPNISKNQTPIMIVHGEDDKIIPIQYSMKLANRNSNVTLHISKKADHSCAQPNKKDYAASILAPWFANDN